MIRINLLRERAPSGGGFSLPSGIGAEIWVGIAVGLAILAVVAFQWYSSSQLAEAEARRTELQQKSLELAAVRNELRNYESLQQQLEERASIIEELRANQRGPVSMMNAIISAIPAEPRLWLTSLSQDSSGVTIEGNAFDVPAIAEFISDLSSTETFSAVELDFWEDREESLAFGIHCDLGTP